MQPKLTLQWQSGGAKGPLGYRGSIGGLSFITRCPQNLYHDNATYPVDFDANDKYCLNGQRLVAVAGAYGADGTEYRTDLEEFSKVVSYGVAGAGPQQFKVWKKSGEILEYGFTADARIEALTRTDVRVWAMNKLSDTVGNYVSFTFYEDAVTGEYGISRVDYTGSTTRGLAPYNHIQFVYETAPQTSSGYDAGQKYTQSRRLTNVKVYAEGSLFRDYRLSYRSPFQIQTITECADATTCFPSTTVEWKDAETVVVAPAPEEGEAPITPPAPEEDPYFRGQRTAGAQIPAGYDVAASGDFNGEGRTDLFVMVVDKYERKRDATSPVSVLLSTQSSLTFQNNAVTPTLLQYQRIAVTGDFNGDGHTDLYIIHSDDDRRRVGGTVDTLWISDGSGNFVSAAVSGVTFPDNYNVVGTGDFNGDGLTDLYTAHVNGAGERSDSSSQQDRVFLSTGINT